MKFLGKLIIWLLIALLLVILAFYFLLQTRWGARHISQWLSDNTSWQVKFDAMDHRFSCPSHILLQNVTFGRDGKPDPGRENGGYWSKLATNYRSAAC